MQEDRKVNIGLDGIRRSSSKESEINKVFAEVFGTPAGKEVLKYLRSVTIEMVHGPDSSSNQLWHHEGQRHIVGLIERRIFNGHKAKSNG